MTTEIHTCSYSCQRIECIRAQRDELASRVTAPPPAAARGDVRGLVAKWRDDVGSRESGPVADCVHECADELEAALAAEGVQAGEVGDVPMTPDRAAFFLRRFKADEKMLGPHEQQALDFAIASLSQQPEARGVVDVTGAMVKRAMDVYWANGLDESEGEDFESMRLALTAALTGERNG